MYYFPLTSWLQKLYASDATTKEMRWHVEHEAEEGGVMRHCSDSPAWNHFDQTHTSFAVESQNVRRGLCTDGFQPFGQSGNIRFFVASHCYAVQFATLDVYEGGIYVLNYDSSWAKKP